MSYCTTFYIIYFFNNLQILQLSDYLKKLRNLQILQLLDYLEKLRNLQILQYKKRGAIAPLLLVHFVYTL